MKKILISLLLVLMLGAIAVCGAACSSNIGPKPDLSFKSVKKALEKADYTVYAEDDEDNLLPMYASTLRASNKDDSITIYWFNDKESAKLFFDQQKLEYNTKIKELELQIKLSEHLLEEYEDQLEDDYEYTLDSLEDGIEDAKDELEELKEETALGIDGKVVWFGTIEAVKDAK